MARAANPPTDFSINVDGVGGFTFGRRSFRDEVKIQVEYARLTEGVEPTPWLHAVCTWISEFKVLTVRAPEGWSVDDMDPLDDETYTKLFKTHSALAEKEGSFRRKPVQAGEGGGSGASAVP